MSDMTDTEKKIYVFFRKMSLLEIITIVNCKGSRQTKSTREDDSKRITGVLLDNAYLTELEKYNFLCPETWQAPQFKKFELIKNQPPGKFIEKPDGCLEFKESPSPQNWTDFLKLFKQIRNNLFHGAKFFKKEPYAQLKLSDRDTELIDAGIAFIKFLEDEGIIPEKLELG